MAYVNFDLKSVASRRVARAQKIQLAQGLMPKRILVKLLFSALAAALAIHFWRQGGRR